MANRRMISKSISTSTKIAEISTFAKLLFTWLIPHCDDFGRMDGSARLIKGIVVPLCDETTEDVEVAIKEMERVKLIDRYEVDGRTYLQINKWLDHQTLRADRPMHGIYPPNPAGIPEETGDIPKTPIGIPAVAKRHAKRREEKLSEEKRREEGGVGSVKYLSSIPQEDIDEWMTRFVVTAKEIRSKAEDLLLYCQRKKKTYANYKAFLLNAIKRDFKERDGKAGKYDHLK